MKNIPFLLPFILILTSCMQHGVSIQTDYVEIEVDKAGNLRSLTDTRTGINYLADKVPAPFLTLKTDKKLITPIRLEASEAGKLVFIFDDNREAHVHYEMHETHASFELTELIAGTDVQLVIWGPYPTSISKSIGETVGIARGEDFTLGIQALNPKTLGGYPWNDNDCMPQLDIFENEDYSDLSEKGKRYVLYRVEAAKPEDFGSTLQAYCRDRSVARTIENWGFKKYSAPPFDDGGMIGSKIALFGCPVEATLEVIGEIELAEGLPHPEIDGEWGKKTRAATAAYMILGFGEDDIEKALEYTNKAGLSYLYHPGPFASWGHFPLNEQFPNGWQGLKNCVETAEQQGIKLGVHTLSNFITPNDAYVSPVPDKRLAKAGKTSLLKAINEKQDELEIASPELFAAASKSNLKTVVVDEELIQYETISQEEPWTLKACIRGAFGTKAAAHATDAVVELLADHAYQVFLSDPELTIEIAKNLARLFNETGIRQISFDGLEGNRSTGMGNYGEILMTNTWFENLDETIKTHYIADASRTSHFFWHIYTRMNWGEPWYAGFRESQTEYRFKNQKYFERNLMPGMLGWFLMTSETNPEDIEWMLAKAAGYDAGFGLVSSYKSLDENGFTEPILGLINAWETARMKGAFSDSIRKELKDVQKEFHLEPMDAGGWTLTEFKVTQTDHNKKDRQPGEPGFSGITFNCGANKTPLHFIITTMDNPVKDVILKIDNGEEIRFEGTLQPGDVIRYSGGATFVLYNKNWQQLKTWTFDPIHLSAGDHSATIDSERLSNSESNLKFEIRIPVKKEVIPDR